MAKLTYNQFIPLKDFSMPVLDKKDTSATTVMSEIIIVDKKKGLKTGYAMRFNKHMTTGNAVRKIGTVIFVANDGHDELHDVTNVLIPLFPIPKEPVKKEEPVKK